MNLFAAFALKSVIVIALASFREMLERRRSRNAAD